MSRPEDLTRNDLLDLVRDLTDPDPCEFDHHGYCQAHGWFENDPHCPHGRAQTILDAEGVER